ncbi:MAG TPA: DNA polymerase III subunit gamma/tau [Armatimonadota bacterium]|jgi:DNA polymerase-3 subunit gamma/tau
MSYKPFALKYRPQTFSEVVGQEHVSQTLRNAVAQGRIHHAYLFAGPRGTGKTSTARVLAKALNCENGPTAEPCGVCSACVGIQDGRFIDVFEMDAASHNSVEDIRELCEKVKYSPAEGRFKVYILDEAHMLSNAASNALLKTLEEPPSYVVFILATTEAHKFPPTIVSRCQRFDFRAIPTVAIVEALRAIAGREGVEVDEGSLWTVAEAAGGAMRDAESIFDRVVAYAEGPIDRETVAAVLGLTQQELLERSVGLVAAADLAGLFRLVDELVAGGKDLGQYLKDLTAFCGDLLRLGLGSEPPAWSQGSPEKLQTARDLAKSLGRRRLLDTINTLSGAQDRLRQGGQEILTVELALAEAAEGHTPPAPVGEPAPTAQVESPAPLAPTPPPAPVEPPRTPVEERVRPAPAPVAVDGPLTLGAVLSVWGSGNDSGALGDELKRMKHPAAWAVAAEARPSEVRGTEICLLFPSRSTFHYNKTRSDYKKTIEEALSRLLGQAVTIACLQGDQAPPPTGSAPPADPTPPVAASQPSGEETVAAEESPCPPAPPIAPGEAIENAVNETLELFPGSRIVPER